MQAENPIFAVSAPTTILDYRSHHDPRPAPGTPVTQATPARQAGRATLEEGKMASVRALGNDRPAIPLRLRSPGWYIEGFGCPLGRDASAVEPADAFLPPNPQRRAAPVMFPREIV
ncbi:MAG: hypothetical protein D6741_09485, partial [Planctomycetota bacterium]